MSSARVSSTDIDTRARRQLGIAALRDEQRRAIGAAANGRDVLAVLATGSGKSAIYQMAGELRAGPSIVVSPLLALQHDQLRGIDQAALSNAAALNSLVGARRFDATLDDFEHGAIEYLFVTPEQLARRDVLGRLRKARPSLFVVDEAHCISVWGYDFRPDYLNLGDAVDAVGRPPVLALTATAAPPVRDDIIARLRLQDPLVVTAGFDRPEIDLRVDRFVDEKGKSDAVASDIGHRVGSGIVYVATRRSATALTGRLSALGVTAAAYHGALSRHDRDDVHNAFLDGNVRVVVATNAFGMGIDKPDVRFVFHHDAPGSLDAYYQEIGRAARDGRDGEAILYYCAKDLNLQRFFAGGAADVELLATVLHAAREISGPASPSQVAQAARRSRARTLVALDSLACVGAVRREQRGRITAADGDAREFLEAAVAAEEQRATIEQSRVDMIRTYAETTWCRRALLLGYYGEQFVPPCGGCDNCRGAPVAPTDDALFGVGERVRHAAWGTGRVMSVQGDRIVGFFDTVGYRTLSTELVRERNLLERAS